MSGNGIYFGVQTAPEGTTYEAVRDHWQLAEALGYDSAWVDDHLLPVEQSPDQDQLECWITMAALARETSTIRIGALVSCHSYRPPSLTAKMAASLDVISDGRLEFGYGYGWFGAEYEAYGYPFPSNKQRSAEFGEALEICRRMWTEEKATFKGEYFHIEEAHCAPKPIQKPLPIWIGGSGPKYTIPWVAKYADAWNAWGTPEEFAEKIDGLAAACKRIGRNPDEIRKTWFGHVLIDADEARLNKRVERRKESFLSLSGQGFDSRCIYGTPDQIADRLRAYIDVGVTGFIMIFGRIENHAGTRLFGEQVLPQFR